MSLNRLEKRKQKKPIDPNPCLSKGLSCLKAYNPFKGLEQKEDKSGGQNSIQFREYPIRRQFVNPETNEVLRDQKTIKVAISRPKENHESHNQEIVEAIKHLRKFDKANRKEQSTLFIQSMLFHDTRGVKVSEAADMDLLEWIEECVASSSGDITREAVAQMLMATDALHEKGKFLHTDLKPNNFLVYIAYSGRVYVEISDIDGVVAQNRKNRFPAYTPTMLAPECRSENNKHLPSTDAIFNRNLYETVDKKAVDCFALGRSIGIILAKLEKNPKISAADKAKLELLYRGLTHQDPKQRYTIQQAMASDYFGGPEYLKKIREQHEKLDIYYDHYYQKNRYSKVEDAFLMWPAQLKEIYMEAASLETQMRVLYGDSSLEQESIKAIRIRSNKLRELILNYPHSQDEELQNIKTHLLAGVDETDRILDKREKGDFLVKPKRKPVPQSEKNSVYQFLMGLFCLFKTKPKDKPPEERTCNPRPVLVH